MPEERSDGREEPRAAAGRPDDPAGRRPGEPEESAGASPGGHVGPARPIDSARHEEKSPAPPPRQQPGQGRPVARRTRQPRVLGAVDRVRKADFPIVLRGYDRAAVDAYVAEVAQLVAELEATQLPETVVQRALDDVGEETSAILKHAHEAAEEIAARSRSQAEGRLHRAERESEGIRAEAEERVRRLEAHVEAVWQERQRLIEDMRQLADEVLAVADEALERVPPPAEEDEAEAPDETAAPEVTEEPEPTREVSPAGAGAGAPDPEEASRAARAHLGEEPTVERRPGEDDAAERPPGHPARP